MFIIIELSMQLQTEALSSVCASAAAGQLGSQDTSRARPPLHRAARRGGTGAGAALLLPAQHAQVGHRHPAGDTQPLRHHQAVGGESRSPSR